MGNRIGVVLVLALMSACSSGSTVDPAPTVASSAPTTSVSTTTNTIVVTTATAAPTTTTSEPTPTTTATPEAAAFTDALSGWLPETVSATEVYDLGVGVCAAAAEVSLQEGEYLEDVLAEAVVGDALGGPPARGPALRLTAAAVELLCPEHAAGLRFPLSAWTDTARRQAIDVGVCVYDEGGSALVVECDDSASGLVMTMFEEDGSAPWPFGPGADEEYQLALATCRSLFEPTGGWGAVPAGTEQDWMAGDQRIACWAEIVTTVTGN